MKLALAMVTRRVDSPYPIDLFMQNAASYGHKISQIIIAYSDTVNARAIHIIEKRAKVHLIRVNDMSQGYEDLNKLNLSQGAREVFFNCRTLSESGLVTYGFNRNLLLMQSILMGMDALIFVDSDVEPFELYQQGGEIKKREVDFFGNHIKYLNNGSSITTSDYSGYNILPPVSFSGIRDLLMGLQKENMLWLYDSENNSGNLSYRTDLTYDAQPTNKILGGNVGFRLDIFGKLPPFFSSYYYAGGETLLARGEDTVLGYWAEEQKLVCTDIDTHIFHDTYKNYPVVPDLKNDPLVQDRFFYACTGWIGRNPFYNWLLKNDLDEIREEQRSYLEKGAKELARYTGNPKYKILPKAFEESWNRLPQYIEEYNQTMEAWLEFRKGADL